MPALIELRSNNRRALTLIEATDVTQLAATRKRLSTAQRSWLDENRFDAAPGSVCLLADEHGKLARVIVGVDRKEPLAALAALPMSLPQGEYVVAAEGVALDPQLAALGWALGAYQFTRYRKAKRAPATLAVDAKTLAALAPLIEATGLVRDLVNTPTEDMGPKHLADAVKQLGKTHKAKVREWVGDELLEDNFPTIHAVGRASHRPPRLIELSWGKVSDPKLVLVGKGVCFDTGGLDLKPSDGMRWMKKDMGGAAHAIALAGLVMQAKLPVRLTLLIPAVENSVAGNAMRPGEVVVTRAGFSVEIDNTDAEGRLVLCDALAYGAEQKPDLIIDFATLTGAARVALGPDLPALFANDDTIADEALACGRTVADPLWRLPLWRPYRKMLESYLADFANAGPSRHAGAITAALYMERFIPEGMPWVHLDTYAWNDGDRPGRPRGGEAMGLRAIFALLQNRYRSR
ncbi:M17 family metallopeptidase [Dyella flava]|uniref:Leucyl aminopeptidase family protein n=1 Tax=Dyella flava TaxID=1920170 RepID=A0ABS2K2Y4_9GAMM|nr:leucyl aminopeptidase family protein [Dyella flava]MBM7124673.1 leucyl aminopeptidase family protein [Dyella flava]GLQ49327.1 cytosol aminopeptidase [Dyella flava]